MRKASVSYSDVINDISVCLGHHIIERLCRSMDKKELHYLFMILLDEISDYLAGDHVIRELEGRLVDSYSRH